MNIKFLAYLEKNYKLNINKMKLIRNAYMLETNKGPIILKKFLGSEQEQIYITYVVNYLLQSGFNSLAPILSTIEGTYYVNYDDELYYLQSYLDGRESDFNNKEDLKEIVQTLTHFHSKSHGIYIPEQFIRNNWGKLDESMRGRLIYIHNIREEIACLSQWGNFDNLFQKWCSYFTQESIDAIDLLHKSSYHELSFYYRQKYFFCHHDLVNHNIIIMPNKKAYLIDFDYSIMDIRVHDLCNFLNHVMKFYEWNLDIAKKIIEYYNKFNPLLKEEIEVLHALLNYPRDFWHEVYLFYREPRFTPDIAYKRLKRNIQIQKARRCFLDKFISAI